MSNDLIEKMAEAIYLSMTGIPDGWEQLRRDGAPSPGADTISKCRRAAQAAYDVVAKAIGQPAIDALLKGEAVVYAKYGRVYCGTYYHAGDRLDKPTVTSEGN